MIDEDSFLAELETGLAQIGVLFLGKSGDFDNATNRHVIERFLGPAPRTVTLDLAETIESFFERVQEEGGEQGKLEDKRK